MEFSKNLSFYIRCTLYGSSFTFSWKTNRKEINNEIFVTGCPHLSNDSKNDGKIPHDRYQGRNVVYLLNIQRIK